VSFALDPRLAADTRATGDLPLSRALLMNDARYPWVILVPRRTGLTEITDLAAPEQTQLMAELARATEILRALPEVEKINIGALGNIVRQLHAHVVGRRVNDTAWPGPVWGVGSALAYKPADLDDRLAWLRNKFGIAPP
jgi:diadenosine tetraphosphate (Ap4A) HIT family hydrolase